MSLLQNEDFLLWQLRTSYLAHDKDGVGERLISLETPALFNDPGIRAAGLAEVTPPRRTYSPDIPVATAVAAAYFKAPKQARFEDGIDGDDGEPRGMVTAPGSTETIGPRAALARRRRREQQEEDDSSDLSDESDEEADASRDAQKIRFAKMPVRSRAGSSPIRSYADRNNPELTITEASKPSKDGRLRSGSTGAGTGAGTGTGDPVRQRLRRDTTTSSEMSSENELDPAVFKRRQVRPYRGNSASSTAPSIEEEAEYLDQNGLEQVREDEEADMSSDDPDEGSSISSFADSVDSDSLLDPNEGQLASSSLADLIPPGLNIKNPDSPRKQKNPQQNTLDPRALEKDLRPRPISHIIPASALGQAIEAQRKQPRDPLHAFAKFSGKASPDALTIKIYTPFSKSGSPYEVILQKTYQDSESSSATQVTVADAIGYCLWRYREENQEGQIQPEIPREKLDVNWWQLRLMDDDEVDYDFPALNRTANVIQFTHNNNNKGRRRGRGFDSFGLVEASEEQYKQNREATPQFTRIFEQTQQAEPQTSTLATVSETDSDLNIIVPKPFATSARKNSIDLPAAQASSTPRLGPLKMLKLHYTSPESQSVTATIEVSSDTYLAEVLNMVCKKFNLDRQYHYLRVSGTSTMALLDRQVAAIGNRTDLDLVRKRFPNEGSGNLATTPSSTPPNALLQISEAATPQRRPRRTTDSSAHPLAQKQDIFEDAADFKRYDVTRKYSNYFSKTQKSVMLLEPDAIVLMPADAGRQTLFDPKKAGGKSMPYNLIIHCKTSRSHPRNFKITLLQRANDRKSKKMYEFEAATDAEATEIVGELMRRAINLEHSDAGAG